jgi:hypothetical protein
MFVEYTPVVNHWFRCSVSYGWQSLIILKFYVSLMA